MVPELWKPHSCPSFIREILPVGSFPRTRPENQYTAPWLGYCLRHDAVSAFSNHKALKADSVQLPALIQDPSETSCCSWPWVSPRSLLYVSEARRTEITVIRDISAM